MLKRKWVHKKHVRAEFKRRVTANPKKRSRRRLRQAGHVYRNFEGRAREASYELIASVFTLVTKYARSERAYERLIEDRYFTKSSRKRPTFESRYSQIMCYVLQAEPGAAREKAQRIGRIIQMLDEQGKRGPGVIGAITDLGGFVKAHEAAKRYLGPLSPAADQAERADVAQRSLDQPGRVEGSELQEDEEVDGGEEEFGSQGGRSTRSPASPVASSPRPRRNYDYLHITDTERQREQILDAGLVEMTCRVEGDPAAKDGWKILTIEKLRILR